MKALIHSVSTEASRGEWIKVHLELWLIGDNPYSVIWDQLKPGAVLTDFGIGDALTQKTNISVIKAGRKLCLD